MHYLYEVVNTVNDKKYIGATSNLVQRKCIHFSDDTKCTKLKNAVKKFGRDKFSLNVLVIGEKDYILDLENKAIALYNTVKKGYNTYKHNGFYNKDPVYVSGFWFVSAAQAISKLNTTSKSYRNWSDAGTLGEQCRLASTSIVGKSVYFKGFWYGDLYSAAKHTGLHHATIRRMIDSGNCEEFNPNCKANKSGSNNPMFGRHGALNHKSRPVIIFGVKYDSIACATRALDGYSAHMISTRLKNKKQGFAYAD